MVALDPTPTLPPPGERGCNQTEASSIASAPANRSDQETLGFALGFAGVILFGIPATRLTVASIDSLFLTAACALIAGCAGISVLLTVRRPLPPPPLWRDLFLAGLCTIVGYLVSIALTMVSVPAARGGVVLLATAAAAAIVAIERLSTGFGPVSLVGAAIVVAFILTQTKAQSFALGDLSLLVTVVTGAFGYALSGRLSTNMPGWEVIYW